MTAITELSPAGPWCQRWNRRSHSWRHRSAGGFNSDRFTVAPLDEATAKAFVVTHHYAGTYPAASRRFGLLDGERLVGVAVYGVPMQMRVLTSVFPELTPVRQSLECSRFALLDEIPANAESWFLARTFEALASCGIRGVVSFADPVLRRADDGRIICPGHIGTIYQASNAIYVGRSTPRSIVVLRDGTTLTARAAQKVRRHERGHDYVERRLVALGAPTPTVGSDPAAWLREALDSTRARRLRHPGCHRYAFPLGASRRERRQVRIAPSAGPYPKHGEVAA